MTVTMEQADVLAALREIIAEYRARKERIERECSEIEDRLRESEGLLQKMEQWANGGAQ